MKPWGANPWPERIQEWVAEQRWLRREKRRIEARLEELAELLREFSSVE